MNVDEIVKLCEGLINETIGMIVVIPSIGVLSYLTLKGEMEPAVLASIGGSVVSFYFMKAGVPK